MTDDPRIVAVPDIHGHAKGEHKLFVDERPIPYTARMLFLWFFHACRRGAPRFLMVADHINYLTFEDPAAVNLVRRALKLAQAGDLYGAAETAGVDVQHAAVVGDGLRRGMRYSIGAEVDNDPRSRPDAQNIVDAMRPDGIVRSVHFLPIKHPQHGDWMWPFDNPEFRDVYELVGTERTWELYIEILLDAIEKLPGHIVGHFYVPAKFGHWPSDDVLEGYEDRLLEACLERGMAVEINSRYYYKHAMGDEAQLEKYAVANTRLLRKAKEKGVLVAVGSDAHSPKDQGRGFAEVLELLDRADINEIAFPIDGRLARVALRATEELRQASSKAAREERAHAVAIPGTEAPEPADDDDNESADVSERHADAPEPAAGAARPAPKKRPSRAKKAPVAEAASNGVAHPTERAVSGAPDEAAAVGAEAETAAEPVAKVGPAAAVAGAIAAVAKRVSKKLAETLQSHEPELAADEPTADGPRKALHADEPEAAVAAIAAPGEAAETEQAPADAETAPAKTATSETAAPEPVVAATAQAPDDPEAQLRDSADEASAPEATPAAAQSEAPASATVAPALARRIKPSRPASAASARPRPAKPVAKAVRRPATAAKKTASSKAAPSKSGAKASASKTAPAAKKRTAKKAAPGAAKKVARPSRPAAKKPAAKKATPVRKAAKAPAKTASRASAKKAGAKKTAVKKKASKSRR